MAIGGTAGVGAGVDVEVITKTTEAWIGKDGSVDGARQRHGRRDSSEKIRLDLGRRRLRRHGRRQRQRRRLRAQRSRPRRTSQTARIDDGRVDRADGSVRVAADETLEARRDRRQHLRRRHRRGRRRSRRAGRRRRTTHACIGDFATRDAARAAAPASPSRPASYTVDDDRHALRRRPSPVSGNTINLGYNHGFADGQEVIYDNGGGTRSAASDVGDTDDSVQPSSSRLLRQRRARSRPHAARGNCDDARRAAADRRSRGGTGESHRLVPTRPGRRRARTSRRASTRRQRRDVARQHDHAPVLPRRSSTDDAVVYSSGGGARDRRPRRRRDVLRDDVGGSYVQAPLTERGRPTPAASSPDPRRRPAARTASSKQRRHARPATRAPSARVRSRSSHAAGFRGVAVTATNSDDIAAVGISAGFAGTAARQHRRRRSTSTPSTRRRTIGSSARINCGATCATNVAGRERRPVGARRRREPVLRARHRRLARDRRHRGRRRSRSASASSTSPRRLHRRRRERQRARSDIAVMRERQGARSSRSSRRAGGGTVGVAGTSPSRSSRHTYACTGRHRLTAPCTGRRDLSAGDNVLVSAQRRHEARARSPIARRRRLRRRRRGGRRRDRRQGHAGVHRREQQRQRARRRAPASAASTNGSPRRDGFGDSASATFHGLAVQATSSEDVFGLAPAVGGGFVGVAGGVGVTLLGVTTRRSSAASATSTRHWRRERVAVGQRRRPSTGSRRSRSPAASAAASSASPAASTSASPTRPCRPTSAAGRSSTPPTTSTSTRSRARTSQTYALSIGGGFVGVAGVGLGVDGRHAADDDVPLAERRARPRTVLGRHRDTCRQLLPQGRRRHASRNKRYAAKVDHASDNGGDDDAPNENPKTGGLTDAEPSTARTATRVRSDGVGAADNVASGESDCGASTGRRPEPDRRGPGHAQRKQGDARSTHAGVKYVDVTGQTRTGERRHGTPAHSGGTTSSGDIASEAKTNRYLSADLRGRPTRALTSSAPTSPGSRRRAAALARRRDARRTSTRPSSPAAHVHDLGRSTTSTYSGSPARSRAASSASARRSSS